MKNPNRLFIPWLLVLSLLAVAPSARALDDLILTEFMAVNDSVLPDEDGDFPDWIELFNSGTNTVNLNGWYLTDNPGNPTKWRFPGATMAPNSYLIVYASSKDRKTVGRPLHTNFKLGSNLGGYLALMKPDGSTVQSRFPLYPVQAPNVSFGFPVTQVTSLLVSNGSQGFFTVPLNAANEAVWPQITFDPAGWANITNGIGFEAEPLSTSTAVLMADSVTDWSASGTQGANSWFYGYWDKKADGNGTYEAADFTPFPRGTGNVLAPTNYWDGTKWDYPAGNPPWTEISNTGAHPSGESGNPVLPIHWPIRRYISETNGNLRITGVLAASGTSGTCGDGTIGRILVDGVEVWQQAVFNRSVGYSITVPVNLGSAIDFAVDPGTANNDFCDTTVFTATIRTAADFAPVADTIADWSITGTQGAKGWQYGWYDVVADTFAGYQTTNFTAFPNAGGPHGGVNFWNGAEWQWFDGEPPFDRIGQYTCTPNIFPSGGTNAYQHWVIRRWTSEVAGTLLIDWHLSKRDLTGGGVTGRIFRNGAQVDTLTVAAAEFNGVVRTVSIPGVQVGDLLDFTVEPGADIIGDDCFFNAVIHATSTLSNQFTSNVGGVMTNINATAWLRYSFNIADPSSVSSLSLRMKYDDGFAAWLNGTLVASANSPLIPSWNSTATGTRPDAVELEPVEFTLDGVKDLLQVGTNVLAIQALNLSAADLDLLTVAELRAGQTVVSTVTSNYFVGPTPGSANGPGTTVLGPIIADTDHEPHEPAMGQDLYVTARVAPTFSPVATVRLYYRIMYGSESNVVMLDDGFHADGVAGDGVYGAVVPGTLSTNGQLIRYYITATDTTNRLTRNPPFPDALRSSQYYGTVVSNPVLTNPLPVLHWFIQTPGSADNATGVRCSIYWLGELYDNVLFNIHGQSSQGFPKKSYDVDFNPDHHFRWKEGESRVDDINLLTTYPDKSQMRNMLTYDIFRNSGLRAPYHYVVPTRVQMNSSFQGTWHIVENGDANYLKRIGRDENGALYKIYDAGTAAVGSAEKKTRKNENKDDLQAMVTATSSLTGSNLRNYLFDNTDVSEVVNKLSAMFLSGNVDCCHKNYYYYRDSAGDGEWEMLPWDVDLSFGRNWQGGTNPKTGAAGCSCYWDDGVYWENDMFVGANATLPNSIYNGGTATATRGMYLRRVRTLMDNYFQASNTPPAERIIDKQINDWAAYVGPDGLLDLAKWGTWATGTAGPIPTNSATYFNVYQAASELLTNYMPARRTALFSKNAGISGSSELPDPQPTNVVVLINAVEASPFSGNQNEEYIRIINTNNIYVDISGWSITGAVKHTFQAGVVIPPAGSSNVLYLVPNKKAFRARAIAPRAGQGNYVEGPYEGQLSARGETLTLIDDRNRVVTTNAFIGAPSAAQSWLRITEVMYHPPQPPSGSPYTAEDFEYIEFRNTGPTNISLAGVHFTNGVEFAFTNGTPALAPGGYVLIVNNNVAFTNRYGAVPGVAGEYIGTLDNSGERLQVHDAVGESILDFSYNNSWYPITDGPGASLVIVNPGADYRTWDLKESWRPSAYDFGSPGLTDPATNSFVPVIISEIFTHTDPPLKDAVEILNGTAQGANLSGWFLSDDFNTPKKYRFPNGSTLASGSYLVVDENQFNTNAGVPPSFSLSSAGDEIYLFSGDGTNLTGYVTGYNFGAAENGITFGRHTNTMTNVHFVAMSSRTLGTNNALPKVGPVAISEIMYRPVPLSATAENDQDEYIELADVTGAPVPLFDVNNATNTWRLRSAVDFDFPTNVTIPANGFVIVANFNPTNTPVLASFRTRFNVPTNVLVFGPYSGKLDNEGESVRLYRPDAPNAGVVPYILVDQVDYLPLMPWPASADGIGPSIQRRVLTAYGNEPTNWIGVGPSPGLAYVPGGTPPMVTQHPMNKTILLGQTTTFSVSATGTAPLFYQWRVNGANISGANNSILSVTASSYSQAGNYSVIIINSAGSIESSPGVLTVLPPPNIVQNPASLDIYVRPDPLAAPSTNASFTVVVTSQNPPLSYLWRLNGTNLTGMTNMGGINSATLIVSNVTVDSMGLYSCAITDGNGTVFSQAATLTPLVRPLVWIGPPNPLIVPAGQPVPVSVVLSNGFPPPFGYQWRSNALAIATPVSNSKTNFFVIPATHISTNVISSTYRVIVTNRAVNTFQVAQSATFTLTTQLDTDRDGIADVVETALGLNPNSAADALLDLDGDGMSNLAENQAGTELNNSNSFLRVSLSASNSLANITLATVSNRTYTVQYSDALPASWNKLADLVARTNNRVEILSDPNWTTNRFYRVVLPAQ